MFIFIWVTSVFSALIFLTVALVLGTRHYFWVSYYISFDLTM